MPTLEATTNVLHITRRFKAARERVFAAFSTLDAMAAWIGCESSKVIGDWLHFRTGGDYQLRMSNPQHGDRVVTGSYQEITPTSKIVFTWMVPNDEEWTDVESLVTIELLSHGTETELKLTHEGLPTPTSRDQHQTGWGASCDKLALYLSA
jgi:uncharacterized protein YndB with AHSA1/START domain